MTEYIYRWGNHKDVVGRLRLQWKGRRCKVIVRGKMNSCFVRFCDNGEQLNCSRNALMKVKKEKKGQ